MYGLNNNLASANNTNKTQNSAKSNKNFINNLIKQMKKL